MTYILFMLEEDEADMINKLERKFGKYAIPDLTLKILIIYAIGYVIYYFASGLYNYILLDPYQIIHGFQIWRVVTWLLAPPSMSLFSFLISAVFFYYPIGKSMENTWGDFKYNLYMLSGFLFTVIGAFIMYLYFVITGDGNSSLVMMNSAYSSIYFTPYYITMSIFFAYAATYPDATVLLMFIIPLKMKWLGYIYGAFLLYEIYAGNLVTRVVIIVSILNFILYFFELRKGGLNRYKPKDVKRRREFQQAVKMTPPGSPRHKCAVCGKTELDDPNLEFRYCSKCKGNLEYCQEHLFTHVHVQ